MSMEAATAPRTWLTPQQIADDLDVAYTSVLSAIHRGELRAHAFGRTKDGKPGKPFRVRLSDFEAWLETRLMGGGQTGEPAKPTPVTPTLGGGSARSTSSRTQRRPAAGKQRRPSASLV